MILKKVTVNGAISENSYFYISEQTKTGVIIDPGAEAKRILDIVYSNGWAIECILLTHGHFDHIGAVSELHKILKVPYYIHSNGARYLNDVKYNFSGYYGPRILLNEAEYFEDNTSFSIGEVSRFDSNSCNSNAAKLLAIHTPGHTSDSTTFYDALNGVAFVGDTIFKGNVGATHFPGGDIQQLSDSIFNRILKLPDETELYSGHTEVTTVGDEKRNISGYFRC